jgi:hypothetical protein
MAANFYYRNTHSEIVSGSAQFAAYVAAHYAELGLTSVQSDGFGVVDAALQAAWSASSAPATRTSVTVKATRLAMKNMRAMAVSLAKQIAANPAVVHSQLVALGLLPRAQPTRLPRIDATPALRVMSVIGREMRVRVRDASGARRGRASNALGCLIYTFIGETPPAGIDGWTCRGPSTGNWATVLFPESFGPGTKVWFTAQWFNARGVGPGCTPVPALIGIDVSIPSKPAA